MSGHAKRRGPAGYARSHYLGPSGTAGITIRVFVAMSFRQDEEPALVDYWQAMQRAANRASGKFEIRRIDKIHGDYMIIGRIYEEIDAADLVIADLTLTSANVYHELGYARGKGKQVVQTCRQGTDLEFDARGHKTLIYQNAATLEEELFEYLSTVP